MPRRGNNSAVETSKDVCLNLYGAINLIGAKPWQQIDGCNSLTSRTQLWLEEFLTTRSSNLPPCPSSVCLKAVHPPAFRGFAPTMRGSYAPAGNRNIDECVCVRVCVHIYRPSVMFHIPPLSSSSTVSVSSAAATQWSFIRAPACDPAEAAQNTGRFSVHAYFHK